MKKITKKILRIPVISAIVYSLLFSPQFNAIAQEKAEKLNDARAPGFACDTAFMYYGKKRMAKEEENYIRKKLKEWNEIEKEAFNVCSLLAQEKYVEGIKKLDEFIEKYEKNYKKDGWFFPITMMYFLNQKINATLMLGKKDECLKTVEKMNQTMRAMNPEEIIEETNQTPQATGQEEITLDLIKGFKEIAYSFKNLLESIVDLSKVQCETLFISETAE
ncbi:MAG: hypothetical protein QXS07_01145 [Candidatus Pacearchaeota archaeon]